MRYRDLRITVMGLGQFGGGASAARWLARQGARVTVTDLADEAALAPALARLRDCPIAALHLGGHREADFREGDLIVVNPAVRPNNRWLDIARQSGIALTTEVDLFLRHCPAKTIGVTGSNGKSTTAAMTAAILKADCRQTWLGGNIGGSLLDRLDEIRPDDSVVLELSSFQLTYLRPDTRVPRIGVLTSFSPNHLDWHATLEEYAAAKRILFARQQPGDIAVINTRDSRLVASLWSEVARQLPLISTDELPRLLVPGFHNRMNAACAATAALAAGCSRAAVDLGLSTYRGLPWRMERIAEIRGRAFYNDSASTTPESTIAALESLECPALLLAGGHDKGFDFTAMLEAIARRAARTAFYGQAGPRLCDQLGALHAASPAVAVPTLAIPAIAMPTLAVPAIAVPTLADALAWCWEKSRPGDAIVLSPGCSSHDQFRNFRERGERFAQFVARLAEPHVGDMS